MTRPNIGDRIRLLRLAPSPNGTPDPAWNKWRHKGDVGTVTSIDTTTNMVQIWVNFDDGGRLALLEGIDSYEVLLQ